MTITGLFMGWTDPVTNNWFPLKKMTWNEGKYYTVYLQGMLSAMQVSEAHRTTVKAGLAKLDRVAISNDIHVSFKVRMPVNRPFTDIEQLNRLGLSTDLRQFEPFEYISRSGGYNGGDTSDLFAETTPDEFGKYHFHFGSGDIKGLEISEYILDRLQVNDRLILKDRLIYHQDFLLGEAPGYITDLTKHHPQAIKLSVKKLNNDEYRFNKVLCHAEIDSKVIIPFSDSHYQPLVDVLAAAR